MKIPDKILFLIKSYKKKFSIHSTNQKKNGKMEHKDKACEKGGKVKFIPWFENEFCFLPSTSQFVEFVLDILVLQNEP